MMITLTQSIPAKDGGDPFEIYHVPGGFGVRRGSINPMPDPYAVFKSEDIAHLAVRILQKTGGSANPDRYWDLWFRATGASQQRRDMNNAEAAAMGKRIVRKARYQYEWIDI